MPMAIILLSKLKYQELQRQKLSRTKKLLFLSISLRRSSCFCLYDGNLFQGVPVEPACQIASKTNYHIANAETLAIILAMAVASICLTRCLDIPNILPT
jgi:hypothetical protein